MADKIMIQGTSSGSGKSTLVAALCRIYKNRGQRVCPYKSQNMSLNSYITLDGKEMGRAQVLQAQAAKIEAQAFMNPILLKPQGDRTSQVIYMGEVYKTMSAKEYEKEKVKFKEKLLASYKKMEEDFDLVVIEGAGSPAEINLRTNDIVNMGLAKLVDSPVILVGDIDKGGVFASLYGTYMLLKEEERRRIKGFVINKFRGDIDILKPGIKMMEDILSIPCLGVIPHFKLSLEDEDGAVNLNKKIIAPIDVGVIRLAHISNFTDLLALEGEEDVSVRYIENANEFGRPDLLVIPGSKNTIGDLEKLKENRLYNKILDYGKAGGRVLGICGGYQMLLDEIIDEDKIEGEVERTKGLGLLKGSTRIQKKKVMKRSKGYIKISGTNLPLYGYEIHMGETKTDENPLITTSSGVDGAISKDLKVMGTYFHGLLDGIYFRNYLVNTLRREKGIAEKESYNFEDKREEAIEELAKIVASSLDLDFLDEIIRRGGENSGI